MQPTHLQVAACAKWLVVHVHRRRAVHQLLMWYWQAPRLVLRNLDRRSRGRACRINDRGEKGLEVRKQWVLPSGQAGARCTKLPTRQLSCST